MINAYTVQKFIQLFKNNLTKEDEIEISISKVGNYAKNKHYKTIKIPTLGIKDDKIKQD